MNPYYNESLIEPLSRRTDDIVLFDGVCNFCNGSVRFIIAHDPAARFRFAPLQSEFARRLLAESGVNEPFPDSVALIESGRVYTRSAAALHIARKLRFPWFLLYAFILVPRPLRDAIYDLIARHRYGWFGKRQPLKVELQRHLHDARVARAGESP